MANLSYDEDNNIRQMHAQTMRDVVVENACPALDTLISMVQNFRDRTLVRTASLTLISGDVPIVQ